MTTALVYGPLDNHFSDVPQNRNEPNNDQKEIPVILPDLFVSFLSRTPQLNPNYERVRAESEAWISKSVHPLYGLSVPSDDLIFSTGNAN